MLKKLKNFKNLSYGVVIWVGCGGGRSDSYLVRKLNVCCVDVISKG